MNNITYNYAWAPSKPVCYFIPPKLKPLLNKYDRLRSIAKKIKLSKDACNRLEWIIWYHTKTRGGVPYAPPFKSASHPERNEGSIDSSFTPLNQNDNRYLDFGI